MTPYDLYNREERAICSHLFRLLHENLDQKHSSPLGKFLNILAQKNLTFKNGRASISSLTFNNVVIYSEMAMIRDNYYHMKQDLVKLYSFMDSLTQLIMKQEDVFDCTLYSKLPKPLNDINQTHPKQIRQKAEKLNIKLNENEWKVYGAMQGMFNAKPDLVITIDNLLLVCEAKFTEKFDQKQMNRTWNIAEVWSTLLYKDIGYNEPPFYTVFKLGVGKDNPNISWEDVAVIAKEIYNENDRTRIALGAGIVFIKQTNSYKS